MNWLTERIAGFGERRALAVDREVCTYADVRSQIKKVDSWLDSNGIEPGDTVAICSDYSMASIAMFLSLMARKAIIVPLTSLVQEEIEERITISGARAVVRFVEGRPKLELRAGTSEQMIEEFREVGAAGLILFSSGSTGAPKAMLHDLDRLGSVYQRRRPKRLAIFLFLMFDHIGGLNTLLNALSMGALVVTSTQRTPESVAALIQRYRVTLLPASPTFLNLLLINGCDERYDLSSLRLITYGTESMPPSLMRRLKARFPKARLLQTYGTSETGIARTTSPSSTSLFMRFEDPDLEIKIVEGELWLRSGTQMVGYLNAPMDRFTEDGWFRTGDLVDESSEGHVRIVGRNQDVINVGGEKVLPIEVETAVLELEEIVDCVAYSLPNSITGQSVALRVVVREGVGRADAKRLIRRHCAERLDRYKNPARIELVDELEVSSRFKKDRRIAGQ